MSSLGHVIVFNRRSNQIRILTLTEFARFFDNRDPRDWFN